MLREALLGTMAMLLLIVAHPDAARAAACAVACKPAVAACAATDCQGLRKRALRHCRRSCKKTILHDCFADVTVCGATSARPAKPSGGGGTTVPTGGSMGGW